MAGMGHGWGAEGPDNGAPCPRRGSEAAVRRSGLRLTSTGHKRGRRSEEEGPGGSQAQHRTASCPAWRAAEDV